MTSSSNPPPPLPRLPFHATKETRIEADLPISARASACWNAIVDFDAYDDWNPVFRHIEGARACGRTGHVRVCDRANSLAEVRIRLLLSEPPVALAWRWSIPGLAELAPEQYFYIDSKPGGASHVFLGTSFIGPLAVPIVAALRGVVVPMLQDICVALKTRAEAAR
jgi:hypothetical protein